MLELDNKTQISNLVKGINDLERSIDIDIYILVKLFYNIMSSFILMNIAVFYTSILKRVPKELQKEFQKNIFLKWYLLAF